MQAVRRAINEHIYHLQVEHGLPLVDRGGVWMFDRLTQDRSPGN